VRTLLTHSPLLYGTPALRVHVRVPTYVVWLVCSVRVQVYRSSNPMGPYTYQGDVIARNATTNASVTQAQQFSVSALRTAGGAIQPLFTVRTH
jgi:hypothetical protein